MCSSCQIRKAELLTCQPVVSVNLKADVVHMITKVFTHCAQDLRIGRSSLLAYSSSVVFLNEQFARNLTIKLEMKPINETPYLCPLFWVTWKQRNGSAIVRMLRVTLGQIFRDCIGPAEHQHFVYLKHGQAIANNLAELFPKRWQDEMRRSEEEIKTLLLSA